MLALVEATLAGQAINVKCLESHYDGARSSFHLFLRRLVDAGVVSISVDERDRRGRLVRLAPAVVARLIEGLDAGDLTLGDPLEIACAGSPRFARALDLWRRLRGYAPLPTLAASDLIAIADTIDGASTHIVERVAGESLDFRFLHVGAVGESERRLMNSDLLSSLPDDDYRERVLQSYRGALEAAAPSLSSVALATRIGTLRYRRLILPFAEESRAAKHLVVIIADPERGR
ncbi:hypothetical protein [Salinarimonas sp.]|uniref:hypothetical protein n=1 Tax=Salinarimonas sp. TaxID=2766526 RepID=UPI00391D1CC9